MFAVISWTIEKEVGCDNDDEVVTGLGPLISFEFLVDVAAFGMMENGDKECWCGLDDIDEGEDDVDNDEVRWTIIGSSSTGENRGGGSISNLSKSRERLVGGLWFDMIGVGVSDRDRDWDW